MNYAFNSIARPMPLLLDCSRGQAIGAGLAFGEVTA